MLLPLTRWRILLLLLLPAILLTLGTIVRQKLPSVPSSEPVVSVRQDAIARFGTGVRVQLDQGRCTASRPCQRPPELSITIVAARSTEDTSWLDVYLGRIRHVVYQIIDANAEYTTTVNKGNEAMPYLQYVIDHYDQLPDISVFSHGAM